MNDVRDSEAWLTNVIDELNDDIEGLYARLKSIEIECGSKMLNDLLRWRIHRS